MPLKPVIAGFVQVPAPGSSFADLTGLPSDNAALTTDLNLRTLNSAAAITGGTIAGLTGFGLRDTSAAFDLTLGATSTTPLTAGRSITLDCNNASQTLKFTAASTVTFPSGTSTLATLGTNTFTALQTITQATANAGILASTGHLLNGSDATSMIDLAGTWNTSGTPTAIKLNITDTASNAASLFFDFQVGGASKISARKDGMLTTPTLTVTSINQGGFGRVYFNSSIDITGSITFDNSSDLFLLRKAPAILQMGADAAGVTNQMFTAASRITSDGVGANLTIAPGNGRGGAGGSLILATYTTAGAATIGTLTTRVTLDTAGLLTFADAVDMAFNATTGTKIGTATGQKLGFWNATPVVQQVLATGGGATVDNVISLLQTLGLCKQS